MFFISISAAVHRPKIGWQSSDILGSSDHRPMIGRLIADGKSWMYISRNYASILQMYTKQVILCNFINVIIVMKTSLIRQPFFYKKKLFFSTFIHVFHIEIQFNIDTRWAGEVRPVSNCSFLPKSADCLSIIGRPSPDALPMRTSWKKEDRSTKLLTWLFRQRNRRPTKASSKIGGDIGRQSTVSLQKTPLLIFAHRKSGDCRLG